MDLIRKISTIKVEDDGKGHMEPLFNDNDDYEEFKKRPAIFRVYISFHNVCCLAIFF